ncbi:PREDICTED: uncharacterized protein LOC106809716 [Priapulus caudatus]|uniref:Uncharacterized protein LOC106809716 n=1 Tax=Priapulus caudatus TaxID=37621 RepID=A0ABM1E859_PRICU|nr:PREDICTED: uncharacterized protein LOC106809716 [Priapulus caudatus]XP_014668391.1 PREDICTED: uncharacterized protein LOC106809716 [Priapulus caudatus]
MNRAGGTAVLLLAFCTVGVYCHFPLMDCIEECFLCPVNVARGRDHMQMCANWCILTAGKSAGSGCQEMQHNWGINNENVIPPLELNALKNDISPSASREKRSNVLRSVLRGVRRRRQAAETKSETEREFAPLVPQQESTPKVTSNTVAGRSTHIVQRSRRADMYVVCLGQCVQCVLLYGYGTYDGKSCANACVLSGGASADPNCENSAFYIRFR